MNMVDVRKLVEDALKVQQYPLEMQEGIMTLVLERAVTLGHQQAMAAVKRNATLVDALGACGGGAR